MSCSNTTLTSLFFLLIFLFKLNYSMGSNGIQVLCPEIEKHSLLSFKQGLREFSINLLSSWDGDVDCCKWKGVVCDNFTGHVHQLHLQGQRWYYNGAGRYYAYNGAVLSGKINSSLLNLKHLRYLDLSYNYFMGETIPSFIGSLTNLQYLNLSQSEFEGKIPHNIGNLSNLQTLDLGGYSMELGLEVDSLEWLRGLSELEHLDMNYVKMSKIGSNWVEVINTLSSLRQLHLRRCSLDLMGTTPLHYLNLTSLTHLDLFYQVQRFKTCQSSSSLLTSIFQLQNLVFLDLSSNCFEGPIPSISNSTKLKHIDLSHNHFTSSIPNWLYFCEGLEVFILSSNLLEGTISNAIANLTSLKSLNLDHNQLSGEIPKEIADLSRIEYLDASRNRLQGELIPNLFAKLSSLSYLDLSRNNLSGNLPESLGQLFNLIRLDIRENMLMSGVVTETYFANLTNLERFSASGNHLMSLKVSPDWIPPINLYALLIGSWTLLGPSNHIPSWLHAHNNNISDLDLSNTGISGNVPTWFWEISYLDLSNNHLHGNIPYIGADFVYLSSNQFNGSLPRIGYFVQELDLSNNSFSGDISHFLCDTTHQDNSHLGILHLGENQLSGELPPDCWTKWSSLRYLNLGNNNMSGTIPSSIGLLRELRSFNLYGNNFSGQIPPSLHNCTYLVKIDLSDNNLHGNIPTQMGTSLVQLRILILHSNKLSGKLSSKLCHLNSLQILDLSNNNFSGMIPRCLNNFTAMATKSSVLNASAYEEGDTPLYYSYSSLFFYVFMESVSVAAKGSELQYDTVLLLVTNINLSKNKFSGGIPKELASLVELQTLNLSENQLTGSIPDSIGDMKQLQSLDLSSNLLSGQIPNTFGHMSFLSYLNLSYNNLTGRIPQGTQLQSFNASSFTGNKLCGLPVSKSCSDGGTDEDKDDDEDEGEESNEIEWFWVFLSSGYAVGLSAVCSALVLKKSWRDAYFGFMEEMWNKFYVYVHIKWARFNL